MFLTKPIYIIVISLNLISLFGRENIILNDLIKNVWSNRIIGVVGTGIYFTSDYKFSINMTYGGCPGFAYGNFNIIGNEVCFSNKNPSNKYPGYFVLKLTYNENNFHTISLRNDAGELFYDIDSEPAIGTIINYKNLLLIYQGRKKAKTNNDTYAYFRPIGNNFINQLSEKIKIKLKSNYKLRILAKTKEEYFFNNTNGYWYLVDTYFDNSQSDLVFEIPDEYKDFWDADYTRLCWIFSNYLVLDE